MTTNQTHPWTDDHATMFLGSMLEDWTSIAHMTQTQLEEFESVSWDTNDEPTFLADLAQTLRAIATEVEGRLTWIREHAREE